jgi:uncharacterized protein
MKKNSLIIRAIKDFVKKECLKPTSRYGYSPFPQHFVPVVKYARALAQKLGADTEVIEISAWLHDIGSILYGRQDHHLTGARIAEEKLLKLGYPRSKIAMVKACILNHRGSQESDRSLLEASILADADAMSAFDDITGVFMAALVYEKKSRDEARAAVRQKYLNSYQKLSHEVSRRAIRPKYDAIMLLLGEK